MIVVLYIVGGLLIVLGFAGCYIACKIAREEREAGEKPE